MVRKSIILKVFCLVAIIFSGLFQEVCSQETNSKTIHIIRGRNFLGSGNKMNIQIDGETVFKLKNGRYLKMITTITNPIEFQIVYPVMKDFKTKAISINQESEDEIYFLATYKGAGNNFRIELDKISYSAAEKIFSKSKRYERKIEQIKI